MVHITFAAVAAVSMAGLTLAHPGEQHNHMQIKRDIAARESRATLGKRALANCTTSATHQALMQQSAHRRAQTLQTLRKQRGITTSTSFFSAYIES